MQTIMEKGSDQQLREAVLRQIEWSPEIASEDISVAARDIVHALKIDLTVPDERIKVSLQNGFAILEGTTDWRYQRDARRWLRFHAKIKR